MLRKVTFKVAKGSTDEKRVKTFLDNEGVNYASDYGLFANNYISCSLDKAMEKKAKKALNLVADHVYYTFAELVEDANN